MCSRGRGGQLPMDAGEGGGVWGGGRDGPKIATVQRSHIWICVRNMMPIFKDEKPDAHASCRSKPCARHACHSKEFVISRMRFIFMTTRLVWHVCCDFRTMCCRHAYQHQSTQMSRQLSMWLVCCIFVCNCPAHYTKLRACFFVPSHTP